MAEITSNDSIESFISITGTSPEEARNFLTVTEGNLQQAITLFYESDVSLQSPHVTFNDNNNTTLNEEETTTIINDGNTVREPIPPKREILVGSGFGNGESSSYSIREHTPRRSREPQLRTFAGEAHAVNKEGLVKLYSPPFDLISSDNFETTRNKAKLNGKWIMINIQDVKDFSSQLLNRDLWSNETVKMVIKAHFYFLQFNSESLDGSKYTNFYPVYKYPHIAVIDPRTGERMKIWDSQLAPTEFLISITDFLERYSLDEGPTHSEKDQISDISSAMSVDDDQIENKVITINDDKAEEVTEIQSTSEETTHQSIFDFIEPIERSDQSGPESAPIKFRLEGRNVIKKFNRKDPVRHIFEYLKASVPELKDKKFELNYLGSNLIEKTDKTIEEVGLISAVINVSF